MGLITITLPIHRENPYSTSSGVLQYDGKLFFSSLLLNLFISPVPIFRVQIRNIFSFEVIPYKHDVRTGEIRSHLIQYFIPDRTLNYSSSGPSQPLVIHSSYTRYGTSTFSTLAHFSSQTFKACKINEFFKSTDTLAEKSVKIIWILGCYNTSASGKAIQLQ